MYFKHVEALGAVADAVNDLILKRQRSDKMAVSIQAAGMIKKLQVSTNQVKDRENNITGYICTVEQVF